MATKTDHVIVRDGSAALGGPPPRIVPKPSESHEAPPAPKAFAAPYSTDHSVVGHFPVDPKTFADLGSTPSPRQRAQRGENVVPKAKTEGGGKYLLGGTPD
jgi:hypothetical protein